MSGTALSFGSLITTPQTRDAVHVAVAPVTSAEVLRPGDHIGLVEKKGNTTLVSRFSPLIGVVDPFLKNNIKPGSQFWMFLYPQTITGLRHEWSHPSFDAIVEKAAEAPLPATGGAKGKGKVAAVIVPITPAPLPLPPAECCAPEEEEEEWSCRMCARSEEEQGDKLAASVEWIRAFAARLGLTYDDLLEGAKAYHAGEGYMNRGELLEGQSVPDEFWPHFETVTGYKVDEDKRHSFFTCSC